MKKHDKEKPPVSRQSNNTQNNVFAKNMKAKPSEVAGGGKTNKTQSRDVFANKMLENRTPESGAEVGQAASRTPRVGNDNRRNGAGMYGWLDRNENVSGQRSFGNQAYYNFHGELNRVRKRQGLGGAGMQVQYNAAIVGPGRRQEMLAYRELVSAMGAEPIYRQETANINGETRHVFFLKVHKAASTTVMNVLYRFALQRHLNIMLPWHSNIISEGGKLWIRNVMPLPRVGSHFDILCNHLVFHEDSIRRNLPADVRFIGIVREPFQQFVSAFLYYRTQFRLRYLQQIRGADPIATYLQNPAMLEAKSSQNSYTHNRMSLDFGMQPLRMNDERYVADYVNYLNRTFHLVMVSERFDESMVLLKRLLGWRLQDVIYIKNNVFASKHLRQYTEEEKAAHRQFNAADYALYEHFSQLFQRKVEAEGRLFPAEVAAYVSLREKVEKFCEEPDRDKGVILPSTAWSGPFKVTKVDCLLMKVPEVPFVDLVRRRQYGSRFLRIKQAARHRVIRKRK